MYNGLYDFLAQILETINITWINCYVKTKDKGVKGKESGFMELRIVGITKLRNLLTVHCS